MTDFKLVRIDVCAMCQTSQKELEALRAVADAARANTDLVVNYNIPRDWALEDALKKLDEVEK